VYPAPGPGPFRPGAAFVTIGDSMRKHVQHGSDGCWRSTKPPVWKSATEPAHHQQVWRLIDWGMRAVALTAPPAASRPVSRATSAAWRWHNGSGPPVAHAGAGQPPWWAYSPDSAPEASSCRLEAGIAIVFGIVGVNGRGVVPVFDGQRGEVDRLVFAGHLDLQPRGRTHAQRQSYGPANSAAVPDPPAPPPRRTEPTALTARRCSVI
jgi:hypothetical protein